MSVVWFWFVDERRTRASEECDLALDNGNGRSSQTILFIGGGGTIISIIQ
jgi:hypothetical protein